MDINNNYAGVNAAINAYQSVSKAAARNVKSAPRAAVKRNVRAAQGRNTDKVELSAHNVNPDEMIKIQAIKELRASASEEKLSSLTVAVREGKYFVPAENIAAALLEE